MSAPRASSPRSPMRPAARWGYGLTGLAQNVMVTCLGVHLFVFYTDVVGLSPLWVSGGLFVATAWDAVSDVYMGRLSDRIRWRVGRRRPFIALGALPLGLAFYLLMAPPRALSGAALGLYFTGALLLLFTAKTVVQVPALAMLPELARGYDSRTRLSAAREQLGNVGDLLGLLLPLALLLAFGLDGSEGPEAAPLARDAYALAGAVIALLSVAALALAYRATTEPPKERRCPPDDAPVLRSLVSLFSNEAFARLMGAAALGALGLAFVQSMILYVFTHLLEEPDPAVHLGAFVLNAIAAIASYPLWTRLAARFGKPFAFRLGLALSLAAFGSVFFVGAGDLGLVVCVMVFGGVANVGFWMLLSALAADVVDLDELAHGARREGLFAGCAALVRKCAFALAAGGVGVGLWAIGYVEGVAPTAETVTGLRLLFVLPPMVLLGGALWVFRRFALTRERHAEVRAQLSARHRRGPHRAQRPGRPSAATVPA